MSCSTNASRSAGVSVSSTTSRARPTESASTASSSGSPAARPAPGPGRRAVPGRHLRGARPGIADRLLVPAPARPEHVERHPGDDRRQPAAEVLHLAGIRAGQPQPGVLHRVVGVGHRAEQAVGHRPQVIAVLLEGGCQPVAVGHLSHSLVAWCHHTDTRAPGDVTCGAGARGPSLEGPHRTRRSHDVTHPGHWRHGHARAPASCRGCGTPARGTGAQPRTPTRPADGVEYVTGDLLNGEESGRGGRRRDHRALRGRPARATTWRPGTWSGRRPGPGTPHLVYISVVGADRIPVVSGADRAMFGYFGSKLAAERVVASPACPGRRCGPPSSMTCS